MSPCILADDLEARHPCHGWHMQPWHELTCWANAIVDAKAYRETQAKAEQANQPMSARDELMWVLR